MSDRDVPETVLAALTARAEGLTYEALVVLLGVPRYGIYAKAVRAGLDRLLADGRVWTLPLARHRGGVVPLYFPAPARAPRPRAAARRADAVRGAAR